MPNKLLNAALKYANSGFSVIPIRKNKRPFVQWEEYQKKAAPTNKITEWWGKWPDANIGLVCGKVSGITVLDADSQDGINAINEFLPESLELPISGTPKGMHYYFEYAEGIGNGVRVLTDCDVRNDGGYVIAPPSVNGENKKYFWHAKNSNLPPLPRMLYDIISQCSYTRIDSNHYLYGGPQDTIYEVQKNTCPQRPQVSTSVHINLDKGNRDNSIFHIANCLYKGGMEISNIRKCLEIIASNCEPPFPKGELETKIKSAMARTKKRENSISEDVRDIILSTSGHIMSTYIHTCLQLSTRKEKKAASAALSRLVDEGLIERTGKKAGEFRILEEPCKPESWWDSDTNSVDLYLPFELSNLVVVSPGDIVLFMGSQNAGKSAILMNIAKENRDNYKVHYFSSEMRTGKFKRRMEKFPDVSVEQLKNIRFYPPEKVNGNYCDHIRSGEGNLNIIDYIEMHDKFWEISKTLDSIYRRLNGAICVAAIQKEPGREYGRGGSFTQEKPVLSISIDQNVATITKCKEWREDQENPNRKEYRFKINDGCRLTRKYMDLGWIKKQEK